MRSSARPETSDSFVIVGRVRRAHGIRGQVVVEPITDDPDEVFAPGRRVFAGTSSGDVSPDRRELHVEHTSPFKGGMIVTFAELRDRTSAELCRNRYLLLPEGEISPPAEGEVWVHELRDMAVLLVSTESASPQPFGEVVEIYELPHGLALDIRRDDGKPNVMLLYTQSVLSVDRAARVITVQVPEGLLE
jgi:16S rRNA processing protein RimM